MEKLHICLVCPDGRNFSLIKQTGTLALALNQAGLKVSLVIGHVETSALQNLHPEISTKHFFRDQGMLPQKWRQHIHMFRQLRKHLHKDPTIDIVHLMSCRWPYSLLAHIPHRLQMPIMANAQLESDINVKAIPFLKRPFHQRALKCIHPLIVNSHHMLDVAKKNGLEHVALIATGVQTDQFKPVLSKRPTRRELGLPEKATLVCCMADIAPENAQLEALERCLPLSEERQLLFIGNAPDKEYLARIEKRLEEKGCLPYAHFLDAVMNPEEYLKASDLFILLGGIEQRHGTILEAQSAGLPVVLAPSPSALMLSNGNRCGVVLYPNNPLAKQAFDKLIADATYRQGRAINTRPYVQKEFGFKKMVQSYVKLYTSF
ncbi:MAG: hypothetical protein CMF62_08565 [Magnetococcales bacterium]|nr:hypothetical protein [Magnetococcales bacterium]|tara:strand:- start:586156 stop:587280 length:1125 start_codon:yes stop_codon:yes gene_type:complete